MPTAFAGIIFPNPIQAYDQLDHMLHTLSHQDDVKKESINLKMYRFKNIQIGGIGNCYATNKKKNIHLFLDGVLDNKDSLIQELIDLGVSSSFETDQEIILLSYEQWNLSFLEKISGEFAIAILDEEKSTIILAKDPVGKKPLYWYQGENNFVFGSELKSMLASNLIPQTVAIDSLSAFFFFGYLPQDMTLIEKVNKLLPANYLIISPQFGLQIVPYWSYSSLFKKRIHLHKSQIISKIDALLKMSVKESLSLNRLKTNPALAVSGGLGSATVAAYVRHYKKDELLYGETTTFKGGNQENFDAAQIVCKALKLSEKSSEITPELLLKSLPKIVWYLDEPLADPFILATWKLAESTSHVSNTLFSGMGSDELLAGHSRYTLKERSESKKPSLLEFWKWLPSKFSKEFLKDYLFPIVNIFSPNAAYKLIKNSTDDNQQFEYFRKFSLMDEELLSVAAPKLIGHFDPNTFLHKFHKLSNIQTQVSTFQYFDFKTRLPDLYILQYERLTRAHNISWQTPFLSKDLIEFTATLPEPENLIEEETAAYLKPLISDYFPIDFINRPKKGKKEMITKWAENQEVIEIFHLLKKGTLVETGIISLKWLEEQLITETKVKESINILFAILVLEVWFRLYINRPPSEIAPEITLKELLLEK